MLKGRPITVHQNIKKSKVLKGNKIYLRFKTFWHLSSKINEEFLDP